MYWHYWYNTFLSLYQQRWRSAFSGIALSTATCVLVCLFCFYEYSIQQMGKSLQDMENHAHIHISQFTTSASNINGFTRANFEKRIGHMLHEYPWTACISQNHSITVGQNNTHVTQLYSDIYFTKTLGLKLHSGRFFTSYDNYDDDYVIVGQNIYDKLVKQHDFDNTITLSNKRYRIIGVLAENNKLNYNIDINNSAISLMSHSQRFNKELSIVSLHVPKALLNSAQYKYISPAVTDSFPKNKFYVYDGIEIISQLNAIIFSYQYIVYGIAFLCMTITFVSVINSLLSSIVQRRQEIGIRLAIGASSADIRNMLFSEMLLLSFFSSCLGFAAAYCIMYLCGLGDSTAPVVSDSASYFGLVSTFTTAFTATVYPAFKAGRFGPIQLMQDRT